MDKVQNRILTPAQDKILTLALKNDCVMNKYLWTCRLRSKNNGPAVFLLYTQGIGI